MPNGVAKGEAVRTGISAEAAPAAEANVPRTKLVDSNVKRQVTIALALAVMWVVSAFLTDGMFISPRNVTNLLRQASVTGILAVGTTMVIITGGIDLSLGSMVALGGIVVGLLLRGGMSNVMASIITLAVGAGIGLWNGFCISKLGIPAFAATLAMMFIARGFAYVISNGCSVSPIPTSFCTLGKGYVGPTGSVALLGLVLIGVIISLWRGRVRRVRLGLEAPSTRTVALMSVGAAVGLAVAAAFVWLYMGIPLPVLVFLGYAAVGGFVMNKTKFGRQLFAVGGNRVAAQFSGVNVVAVEIAAYVISGLTGALAGMVLTARLANAIPTAAPLAAFDAIAAVLIGGTSIVNGTGTMLGSVLGTLVIGTIDNAMNLMGILITYQYIVKGLIILAAVYADVRNQKRRLSRT